MEETIIKITEPKKKKTWLWTAIVLFAGTGLAVGLGVGLSRCNRPVKPPEVNHVLPGEFYDITDDGHLKGFKEGATVEGLELDAYLEKYQDIDTMSIPKNVSTVDADAFYGYQTTSNSYIPQQIKKLNFLNDVSGTYVGYRAFSNADLSMGTKIRNQIETIDLANVTTLYTDAFSHCPMLKHVIQSNSTIVHGTFGPCFIESPLLEDVDLSFFTLMTQDAFGYNTMYSPVLNKITLNFPQDQNNLDIFSDIFAHVSSTTGTIFWNGGFHPTGWDSTDHVTVIRNWMKTKASNHTNFENWNVVFPN